MADARRHRVILDWSGLRRVEVYAPWCPRCASDENTRWDKLPMLSRMLEQLGKSIFIGWQAQAICHGCKSIIDVSSREAWRAREPERLELRLDELRADSRAP